MNAGSAKLLSQLWRWTKYVLEDVAASFSLPRWWLYNNNINYTSRTESFGCRAELWGFKVLCVHIRFAEQRAPGQQRNTSRSEATWFKPALVPHTYSPAWKSQVLPPEKSCNDSQKLDLLILFPADFCTHNQARRKERLPDLDRLTNFRLCGQLYVESINRLNNRLSTKQPFPHMQKVGLAYLSTELVTFRCPNKCDVDNHKRHGTCDVVQSPDAQGHLAT
jgi:hypothetical protein